MGIGLLATGVLNVLFVFSHSLPVLLFIWTLNGFFQGWGWPPCARLLTHWYSRNERGFWWGCWNTSINIGGAIVPLICAFAAHFWGWRAAMLAPGIVSIVLGIWLTAQLRGTPQEEGLPTVGEWRNDPLELRQQQHSPPMGLWQMLRTTVLQNPMIWLLGASYVLVYLIRIALNDWGNIWLAESHGVNLLSANATVMLFEAGGLLGALFAGWGSDLLFSGQRALAGAEVPHHRGDMGQRTAAEVLAYLFVGRVRGAGGDEGGRGVFNRADGVRGECAHEKAPIFVRNAVIVLRHKK